MIAGVDLDRLAGWMNDAGLAGGRIRSVERLGGGTQNILVRFERGGRRYVLRRPPLHKRDNSDNTMRREARVLAALAGSDVPHPRLIAACGDTEVLGAAFYLMEQVDGANPTVALPRRYVEDRAWRWQLGLAMADGAAAVGAVDHVAAGLADLGRPEGYLERQLSRWQRQLQSYAGLHGYAGSDLPGVDRIATWLERNRPSAWQPGLMHGDYHFGNVLCSPVQPGLAAIVDWELTTVGDPLVDLGWLLATWPDDEADPRAVQVRPWDGFPTPAVLVAGTPSEACAISRPSPGTRCSPVTSSASSSKARTPGPGPGWRIRPSGIACTPRRWRCSPTPASAWRSPEDHRRSRGLPLEFWTTPCRSGSRRGVRCAGRLRPQPRSNFPGRTT